MINLIHYTNKSYEKQFKNEIEVYYNDVRKLLPRLPENMNIYFSDSGIISEMGVGGFAASPDTIRIALDSKYKDPSRQHEELRSTIYHEAFHVVHEYTGQTGPFSFLDSTLQEGAATVFEREYANGSAGDLFGNYKQHSTAQLNEWLKIIKTMDTNKQSTKEDYNTISFYDPVTGVRWRKYKVGTWLIDKHLIKSKIDIKDLTNQDIVSIKESAGL